MDTQKFAITSISHPHTIKYIPKHLESIKKSIEAAGVDVPVVLVFSQSTPEFQVEVEKMCAESGIENLNLICTEDNLTVGGARNLASQDIRADWILFTDCDTELSPEYVSTFLQKEEGIAPDVAAITGGISITETTDIGHYSAASDVIAIVRSVKGATEEDIAGIFGDTNGEEDIARVINQELVERTRHLSVRECKYLQGFNQIIRGSFCAPQSRGFNEDYGSAEDREMGAFVQSCGYKNLFIPELMMGHNYDFTLPQLLQRGIVHGIWSHYTRLESGNPSADPSYWLINTNDIPSTHPFHTPRGREFLTASDIAYSFGNLQGYFRPREEVIKDHREGKTKSQPRLHSHQWQTRIVQELDNVKSTGLAA